LFRLDESKGTGRGYDRLCIDMNFNNDLSDDPVIRVAAGMDNSFGPFPYPGPTKVNGNLALYAKLTVYGGPYPTAATMSTCVIRITAPVVGTGREVYRRQISALF
jgi:hypothetical protein